MWYVASVYSVYMMFNTKVCLKIRITTPGVKKKEWKKNVIYP